MEAITKVNYGYSPRLSSSLHPRRPSITKPCFFKPPPSPTFNIKPISIKSSPASSSSSSSSYRLLTINKIFKSETIRPSPSPIIRILRTMSVAAVTAVAAFFIARFSHPRVLAAPFLASVETAGSDEVKSLRAQLLSILLDKRSWAEANGILEQLLQIEPEAIEWQVCKGHMHAQRDGDIASAKSVFAEIIITDPFKTPGYHAFLNYANSSGELAVIKKAIDIAFKFVSGDDLRDFKKLDADYHIMAEEYEEAFRIYDELISEDPEDFEPYLCKGVLHTQLMQKEEGEESFEKYATLVPKDHPYARHFEHLMIEARLDYSYKWRMKRERKSLKT